MISLFSRPRHRLRRRWWRRQRESWPGHREWAEGELEAFTAGVVKARAQLHARRRDLAGRTS